MHNHTFVSFQLLLIVNPKFSKDFLHSDDNLIYQKDGFENVNRLGGKYYRDNLANTNNEYSNNYQNLVNQNNPYPLSNLSDQYKNYAPYGTNLNPDNTGNYGQLNNNKEYRNDVSNKVNYFNGYNYDKTLSNNSKGILSLETKKPSIEISHRINSLNNSKYNTNQDLFSQNKLPVNKIFKQLYFHDEVNNKTGDERDFYSKKKIQLINDFESTINKQEEYDFKRKELEKRNLHNEQTNVRLNEIGRSISPGQSKFYEYKKKLEYKTVFDDKKIIFNKVNFGDYYPYDKRNPTVVNY